VDKEDIIRMAREAGGADITSHGWTSWVGTQSTDFLERFAALVAAQNRSWVGLTDEEIGVPTEPIQPNEAIMFARVIEALIKGKNT
jgi:hypothetical protein